MHSQGTIYTHCCIPAHTGSNSHGQLGIGRSTSDTVGASASTLGSNLPAVDLGSGRTVRSIAAFSRGSCTLLDNNKVKCWGRNTDGQLGLGYTTGHGASPNSSVSTGAMGNTLPYVDLGTGRTVKWVY